MQFRKVAINGGPTWVFVFSKKEVEVFKQAARNKQAPVDERIVHFVLGRGAMWTTDGHQMVVVEARPAALGGPDRPDQEFAVSVHELKSAVSKAKVTDLVVLDCGTFRVGTISKCELFDGAELDPNWIGDLELATGYDYTAANLSRVVDNLAHDTTATAAPFKMSTRFGGTLAAISKATGDAVAAVFMPPSGKASAVVWQVPDENDGALWRLVAMPTV